MSVALEEIHLPGSFLGTCAFWFSLLAVTGAVWVGYLYLHTGSVLSSPGL